MNKYEKWLQSHPDKVPSIPDQDPIEDGPGIGTALTQRLFNDMLYRVQRQIIYGPSPLWDRIRREPVPRRQLRGTWLTLDSLAPSVSEDVDAFEMVVDIETEGTNREQIRARARGQEPAPAPEELRVGSSGPNPFQQRTNTFPELARRERRRRR